MTWADADRAGVLQTPYGADRPARAPCSAVAYLCSASAIPKQPQCGSSPD